jgi:hypothetical protein
VEFAALDNYPSACLLQPELEAYLAKDLALGHLAKVHVSQVVSPLRVYPIALVPKPGQPGKFCLITDISSPAGTSINDLTLPPPPLQMVKIRNLFRRIRKFMWGGKIDVAHAFRNIPLALLFAGHLAVLAITTTSSCASHLVLLGHRSSGIPFPILSRDIMPSKLDFVAMTVSASPERVASILDILRDFLSRKSVPFSKFERLVGKLSFVAQIISGGRIFLWHLFNAYPSSRHGHVKISPSVLADLSWWSCFLPV